MDLNGIDPYLERMLQRYDTWMAEGKIPVSSKVVPVNESLSSLEWVLPTSQVLKILRNSRCFALQNCICRTRNQRCTHPVEVCIVTNDAADLFVSQGRAKTISLNEATQILKLANQKGLVHLTLYNPEQHVYAICSCCDCCCHHLQIMKLFQRPDIIAHADYIAAIDPTKCIHCGKCTERCIFGAQVKTTKVEYRRQYCYGCGLCQTTCPTGAITMELRT